MASVYWEHTCAFTVGFLHCGDSVTAERCCSTLRVHSCLFVAKGTICAIAPRLTYMWPNLRLTMALDLGGFYHRPYITDLKPSDFRLVASLKKYLTGKKFAMDADVKQAVISWLQTVESDFFYGAIQTLLSQWYKFSTVSGNYLELW